VSSSLRVRKWYFGINEAGVNRSRPLIMAAVKSCLANTPLQPHCLYFGTRNKTVDQIERMGVRIIPHVPSLEPELTIGYGERYPTFAGHWLRTDLPAIEMEDDFILYTDIDVLFLRWRPELLTSPMLLAAAPEHRIEDTDKFNSGVMVINVRNMRSELPRFHAAIRRRVLNDFKYPAHDQKSFNDHFRGRYDHLDPLLNWKPYWGRNDETAILHFHGPKPRNIPAIKSGQFTGKAALAEIWARNPEGYDHYCDVWHQYLALAQGSGRKVA
jgi:hypothetical protein